MIYWYEGHDAAGNPKLGTVEAISTEKAAEQLRAAGIFAMNIETGNVVARTILPNHKAPTHLQQGPGAGDPPLPGESFDEFLGVQPKTKRAIENAQRGYAGDPPSAEELVEYAESWGDGEQTAPGYDKKDVPKVLAETPLLKALMTYVGVIEEARKVVPVEELKLPARLLLKDVLAKEFERQMAPQAPKKASKKKARKK